METKKRQSESIKQREERLIAETIRTFVQSRNTDNGLTEFFSSVLTASEQRAIGRRLLIARMYLEGYSGAEIRELLRVSPNTLSSVRTWVEDIQGAYTSTKDRAALGTRTQRPRGPKIPPPFTFARLKKITPRTSYFFLSWTSCGKSSTALTIPGDS
jgi:uncharacterized protein YerC